MYVWWVESGPGFTVVLVTSKIRSCFSARLYYCKLCKKRTIRVSSAENQRMTFMGLRRSDPGIFPVSKAPGAQDMIPQHHPMALLNKGVQERHHEPGRNKSPVPASSFEEGVATRGRGMGERLCLGGGEAPQAQHVLKTAEGIGSLRQQERPGEAPLAKVGHTGTARGGEETAGETDGSLHRDRHRGSRARQWRGLGDHPSQPQRLSASAAIPSRMVRGRHTYRPFPISMSSCFLPRPRALPRWRTGNPSFLPPNQVPPIAPNA